MKMKKRIITTENLEEDLKIENHLRPQLLKDYIGCVSGIVLGCTHYVFVKDVI